MCLCVHYHEGPAYKPIWSPYRKITNLINSKDFDPCGRYTVEEDMEIINFISKNNLHGRVLGIKMYKWAAVSF